MTSLQRVRSLVAVASVKKQMESRRFKAQPNQNDFVPRPQLALDDQDEDDDDGWEEDEHRERMLVPEYAHRFTHSKKRHSGRKSAKRFSGYRRHAVSEPRRC